jgi:hypothetical protein
VSLFDATQLVEIIPSTYKSGSHLNVRLSFTTSGRGRWRLRSKPPRTVAHAIGVEWEGNARLDYSEDLEPEVDVLSRGKVVIGERSCCLPRFVQNKSCECGRTEFLWSGESGSR